MMPRACAAVIGHLNGNLQRAVQLEWSPIHKLTHVTTFDMLHHDVMHSILLAEIENCADVRMIKRRSETRFTIKALQVGVFASEFRRQHFNDNGAPELSVGCFVDSALAARANLVRDFEAADGLADHGGGI
jgi:hypothetical protein